MIGTRARYQGMFSEAEVLEYWNKDITRCHGFPVEMFMAKVITTVDGGNPAPPGMYKTM